MNAPEFVRAIARGLQAQREHDLRIGRAECPVGSAVEQAIKPSEGELNVMMMMAKMMAKEAHDELHRGVA